MNEQLLGLAEIADLYAVDKATANNWSRSRDFPEPRWRLKMGPIWTLAQVERWRIPARTVEITEETKPHQLPPAFILSVDVDKSRREWTFGVTVKCPLCPKKHYHGASLGSRVPHCGIPHFDAMYNITDPDGLLAQAAEKYEQLRERLQAPKEDA